MQTAIRYSGLMAAFLTNAAMAADAVPSYHIQATGICVEAMDIKGTLVGRKVFEKTFLASSNNANLPVHAALTVSFDWPETHKGRKTRHISFYNPVDGRMGQTTADKLVVCP